MEFLELFDDLDISYSGSKLIIEGRDYTLSKFRSSLFDIIDDSKDKTISLLLMKAKDVGRFNIISKEIFESLKSRLKPTYTTGLSTEYDISNLTPVVSIDDREVYLIDEANDIVSEIQYNSWVKSVPKHVRKVYEENGMPYARFFFDPYDHSKIRRLYIDDNNVDMIHINQYRPPMWMKDSIPTNTYPSILKDFMEHLIPNSDQREYCLKWMAEAVFGRNETYLVLNGDKGVGKNTIYEILKAVIGAKYSVTAPASLTTSHFNSVLLNKRLILLDEYKINRANHLFLKKIINKNQTIEKKGLDADKEVETFNSFMIFHNSISDMYIEKDDRRFSVLDITSKNLLELWSPQYINDLMIELNDPKSNLIKEIGVYLKYIHTLEFNNTTPYKGDKFNEIVEYHLPTWIQITIAMIENGEVKGGVISFKKEIEKRLSNEMMGKKKIQWRKSTLQKVLKEYRYKGQWSLGTIDSTGQGGSLQVIVNPDLLEMFNYDVEEEDFFEEDEDLL